MPAISGPSSAALSSLTTDQIAFIRSLPKAELHAHLNGSIPLHTLQQLAIEHAQRTPSNPKDVPATSTSKLIQDGLDVLRNGVNITQIADFFSLFPSIYTLTSTPNALRRATRDVLKVFLQPSEGRDQLALPPECSYIELRTTPRATAEMTRRQYLDAVLDEVECYSAEQAALIVSVDRRMSVADAKECVELAVSLRDADRRVVGVDLCGSPDAGNMKDFLSVFEAIRSKGLGLTLHIAEIQSSGVLSDTDTLLSASPSRLGHATFLTPMEVSSIISKRIPIEVCLTSNLLCKTVTDLKDHHIHSYLKADHPIAICTDDILPFRTSLTAEYALLLAQPPLGLGLTEAQVERIAQYSMECRFMPPSATPHHAPEPGYFLPTHIFGSQPSSPPIEDFMRPLLPMSAMPKPELQSYSNAVYMNYHSLGISLLYTPINGYQPTAGTHLEQLRAADLILESLDIYNVAAKVDEVDLSKKAGGKPSKLANAQYSPYPCFPISVHRAAARTTEDLASSSADLGLTLDITPETMGKDFVKFLGEPSRKGGGGGPSVGSIGVWCEWKALGLMVEFGGEEAQGWERGKDARWAVITFFKPTETTS